MEINKFLGGTLLDSVLLRANGKAPRFFIGGVFPGEKGESAGEGAPPVRLVCSRKEAGAEACEAWGSDAVAVAVEPRDDFLVSYWARGLLEEEKIEGFGSEVHLKPWKVSNTVWIVACLLVLYGAFALFKAGERNGLARELNALTRQRVELEARWKPVEELQNRIPKLQEGQKTIENFESENYSVLELLTLLTQATPDDTWVNYFAVKGRELTLRGESPSAIKYLSDLSKIPGFGDVRFGSPVSKNPTSDKERFHIQVQCDVDKLKKGGSAAGITPNGNAVANVGGSR
jgi:Tfp pilus assembly protein PilN